MNRIFKVIWSKTKKCYIVVSELANNYDKSSSRSVRHTKLNLGILAMLLVMQTGATAVGKEVVYDTHHAGIIGENPSSTLVYQDDGKFTGLDTNDFYTSGKKDNVLITFDNSTKNGLWKIQLNKDIVINSVDTKKLTVDGKNIDFGSIFNNVSVDEAKDSSKSGNPTKYTFKFTAVDGTVKDNIITYDYDTHANIKSATLNGKNLTITDTDNKSASVDLSSLAGSSASFTEGKGIAINDDVISAKLKENGGLLADDTGISVDKSGTIANGNSGLVTGGTVYNEVRPAADGTYVKTDSTTGQNLTALDSQVKSNADAIGTNITNISKNAGDIAVNQQDISSLKDLSNITTAGTTVIKNAAKEAIDVQGTDLATVTSTVDDQSGKKTYTVSVKADGKVADGDTKLVSGDTVYDALQTEKGATETALNGKANVDASNLTTGNVTSWQNVLGNGIVANGNSGLVTGGTVYNEVRPAADGTYVKTGSTTSQNLTALDSQVKSNADAIGTNITNISKNAGDIAVNQQDISSLKDLSNITTAGTTVIKNAAKEAIDVQGTDLATVTSTVDDQSGKKTYTVSVKADGKVADGDTKLVSGDTVYDALQTEKGATETALNGKANVDASNLTTGNVTSWQNVLGNGIVANGNSGLVTGGTVYNEVRQTGCIRPMANRSEWESECGCKDRQSYDRPEPDCPG